MRFDRDLPILNLYIHVIEGIRLAAGSDRAIVFHGAYNIAWQSDFFPPTEICSFEFSLIFDWEILQKPVGAIDDARESSLSYADLPIGGRGS